MSGYLSLDSALHGHADQAKSFFAEHYGIKPSRFHIESRIHPSIAYKPTMYAETKEKRLVCVEVASRFTASMEGFVLACVNHGLPVEMFIAFPPDGNTSLRDASLAMEAGLGIAELGLTPQIIRSAVPLSLRSVRPPDLKAFPAKYRRTLKQALQLFKESDPPKGTLAVYQEIETLTRSLAEIAAKKGAWKGGAPSALKWDKDPWQNITELLLKHLDSNKLGCPDITLPLLGRIVGVCDYRNKTGHKPKTLNERLKMDTEIRTRFENASDVLLDLVKATRKLKL